MNRFLVAALVSLLLPASASAFDLTVRYDVDATALKAAVAGTPLTFNLHTDAACMTAAIATAVVDVEDVAGIEVLKRFTPKGGTKPPKTARLNHVLSAAPVEPAYWLSVSGTGVTPVGGACQAQASLALANAFASVPAGVISVLGSTLMASVVTSTSADAQSLVLFETELSASAPDQYILCYLLMNAAIVDAFLLDPGDADSPINHYDLRQTYHRLIALPAGANTLAVDCNVASGPAVNTYAARITVLTLPGGA